VAIYDQYANLFRFGISFAILFFFLATIIFKEQGEAGERFFSRYVKMVFLIIVVGYIFVLIKLYEVISLFAFITLFSLFWRMPAGNRIGALREQYSKLVILFYETLDGNFSPLNWAKNKARDKWILCYQKFLVVIKDPTHYLLLAVICGAVYLRFHDPLTHAAPGLSDASVAVAWMKYISERILFHDGIYPQGLHIYDATLRKFSGTDAIYVVKYVGPLNGVLTTLALYFFVQQLTGRKSAGVISAFVFGVLGPFLYLDWQRQAATNSQEFALIFMFLAWNYTLGYFKGKGKSHLFTGAIALAVTGLLHSLVWAFTCLGVVLMAVCYLVFGPLKNFKAIVHVALAGVISGVISAIPLGIGLLMGKGYHSSSLNYLTSIITAETQQLTLLDDVAIVGMGLTMVLLFLSRWIKQRPEPLLFIILLSSLTLLSYIYLGWLTGNTLIIGRIGLLWSVVACLAIGVGWHGFISVFIRIKPLEIMLCLALVVGATYFYRPMPAEPYKMMHDAMVNQYLKIADEFTPTSWLMVSNEEGYALALGKAWHMHLSELVDNYSPETRQIVKISGGSTEVLETEDIFLFVEKIVFEPPANLDIKVLLDNRKVYYQKIEDWVKTYSSQHNNISVYYEDENIKIYHINQPKKKEFEKVWNT